MAPEELDLEFLRGQGRREGEAPTPGLGGPCTVECRHHPPPRPLWVRSPWRKLRPTLVPRPPAMPHGSSAACPSQPRVAGCQDEGVAAALQEMGFGANACKRAAVATKGQGPEAAMEWLLSHMEVRGPPSLGSPVRARPPVSPHTPPPIGSRHRDAYRGRGCGPVPQRIPESRGRGSPGCHGVHRGPLSAPDAGINSAIPPGPGDVCAACHSQRCGARRGVVVYPGWGGPPRPWHLLSAAKAEMAPLS